MAIDCLVLGAGQEVGKSCVVVTICGKRVMFDCGMHMGYKDHRRYPDFSRVLAATGAPDFTTAISCVVITHFHQDHIGALPYFTEVCGYHGPIYMTYPTKALAPFMLEDNRKVMVDRRGEEEQYSYEDILRCMEKVTPLDLKQTVQVDKDLIIRAYYAGHVLGAAMIYAKVGDAAMVYTGDYNMTPDRHLGAAQIDHLKLDLLITESTYAKTIRDSRRAREREFLKAVHKCVSGGGKVLIPTFALGRAQELCMLLDDYWERMNLKVPIYLSAGLTIQSNMYYKMLIGWTSQQIKDNYAVHNPFDFKHVCHFERSYINNPGPCVLFATPGMIFGGFSLEVFKKWAPSEKNLVALPGYCSVESIGHKLTSNKSTKNDLDKDTRIDVRCQIHQLAFSPHTDSKGIMDLIEFLSPKHVILVHGEKPSMAFLKERIESELGTPCYYPANHETVSIPTTQNIKMSATERFITTCAAVQTKDSLQKGRLISGNSMSEVAGSEKLADGIILMEKPKKQKILSEDELLPMASVPFLQKILAEIFGTYFLIFAGCGAVTINASKNGQITFPGVAIVWGLVVMVMVYAVGHISGAHFNPAVTFAFATSGRFPWRQVPAYALAQMLGATLAAGTLRLMFGGRHEHFPGTLPSGSDVQSLVIEIIITFYLMFVISGVATDNRAIGELAGLAVGATILLNVLIAGPVSGASMNPARSIGPALISGEYRALWVYIVGPIVGAVAGAWAYNLIRFTNKPLREITKSTSFLKSMSRMNSSA